MCIRDRRDADAIAAHLQELRLPLLVEEGRVHALAVVRAEQEDVADLDAALDLQDALAIGRRIAGDRVADVGDEVGLGKIAAPVDAGVVEVFGVGAGDEIADRRNGAIARGQTMPRSSLFCSIAAPTMRVMPMP